MAVDYEIESLTRIAGADLNVTGQYRFVKQANDGTVTVCNVAGESALGILQNNPKNGQAATVAYGDVLKIYAGGTIAPGDMVATDTQGRAVVAANGQAVLGEVTIGASINTVATILFNPKTDAGDVLITSTDSTLLQTSVVTVSSAEVLALHATPKTLVAAPGIGYSLVLDSAVLFLDYNSTPYNGIAGAEDLEIRHTNGSGTLFATIETTGFLDASADAVRFVQATTSAAIIPTDNAPLVLDLASGEIATGDSPLKIQVKYRVIPTSL